MIIVFVHVTVIFQIKFDVGMSEVNHVRMGWTKWNIDERCGKVKRQSSLLTVACLDIWDAAESYAYLEVELKLEVFIQDRPLRSYISRVIKESMVFGVWSDCISRSQFGLPLRNVISFLRFVRDHEMAGVGSLLLRVTYVDGSSEG